MAEMRKMEIEPAENGGHVVTHHMKPTATHSSKMGMGMQYEEPETHVFGKGQGKEMMAHVAKHMGMAKEGKEDTEEDAAD